MHHIQKSIIISLARTSPLRFTDLQPPRIPNNAFSYHLKKLIDGGYVELTDKGYVATRKALKLVVFGVNNAKTPRTPDLITLLYIENIQGEVLLVNRNHRPFQGWYGIPGGLIHYDETVDEAARRELFEKTTIDTKKSLKAIGTLDFRYAEAETNDIFVHAVGFLYYYKYLGDREELNDKMMPHGQLSWSTLQRDNILPEVFAARDLINQKGPAHSSATFKEPAHLPVFSAA